MQTLLPADRDIAYACGTLPTGGSAKARYSDCIMDHLTALQVMDRNFFGYGHWSAPYWFIGPEQGKGRGEADSSEERLRAWEALQRPDICDCASFHRCLGDTRWHLPEAPGKLPPLQPTWRSLMFFLLEYLGESSAIPNRKSYQANRWGAERGDTCVIELSGIASRRLRSEADRHEFLEDRIERIRYQIASHKPKLVLMYGLADRPAWKTIAGQEIESDSAIIINSTLFLMSPHPLEFGRMNTSWKQLAARASALQPRTPSPVHQTS